MEKNTSQLPKVTTARLIAYLTGELQGQEKQALESRLATDSDAMAELESLQTTWDRLEPPAPPLNPPESLAFEIMTAVRRENAESELSWLGAPTWAKAGSLISLMLGIAIGGWSASPSSWPDPPPRVVQGVTEDAVEASWEPTLVDAYWQVLEDTGGRLGDAPEGELP